METSGSGEDRDAEGKPPPGANGPTGVPLVCEQPEGGLLAMGGALGGELLARRRGATHQGRAALLAVGEQVCRQPSCQLLADGEQSCSLGFGAARRG